LASPHCKVKNGARGNGEKHALYVGGDGKYGDRNDVAHVEDGNLPKWASNAVEFFKAADDHERANGRVYKEVEAAIPREAKDPVKWAQDYAKELLGDEHPYRLAIHDKQAQDGGRNVHMHLMFSTRTMDGYNREPKHFFKNGAPRKKGKELTPEQIAKGGARKSDYWNAREAVPKTRAAFELNVQRVAPEFRLKRSDAPEPKIGPVLKYSPQKYEEGREQRVADVYELRTLKKERAALDKEIELEELMVGAQARRPSSTNALWAKVPPKGEPQREPAGKPDWSKFQSVAGTRAVEDQEKGMTIEPQNGQQYFPQWTEEKERNRDDAGTLQHIEQQQKNQKEQEPPKSRSDDLWERMQRDRQEKTQQQGRENDSSRDIDM
jgi:hypothetical protein